MVTWVRSWRAGLTPFDELAAEIAGDEEHLVADAPGAWTDIPLGEALSMFAKLSADEIALVLPVPGDPRGLPGPGAFTSAALIAEEGVVAGPYGLVPQVRAHVSGSGDEFSTVLWQVHPVESVPPPSDLTAAQAEGELAEALLEATRELTRLDVAQWRPEIGGSLAALRSPHFAGDLPPGYDARSRRLFARASVLDQVLALAYEAAPGGAINGYEAARRDDALRPLWTSCRRALVAACNAPLRA